MQSIGPISSVFLFTLSLRRLGYFSLELILASFLALSMGFCAAPAEGRAPSPQSIQAEAGPRNQILPVLLQLLLTESPVVETPLPAAPSSLTASAASSCQINLMWQDKASNEDGFKVERASSLGGPWNEIGTIGLNAQSYTDMGLEGCATYYYRVCAYNNAGYSDHSNTASTTTPLAEGAPATPSSLTASVLSSSQINVSWQDNATNETGFKIEQWTSATGSWIQITTVGANVNFYSNTDLSESTRYYYRVRAYNAAGNSSYSNTVNAITQAAADDATAPSVPTGLMATAVSCSQINLSWSASSDTGGSGLMGYKLYRNGSFIKLVPAPSTSSADTGLAASTIYSYAVSAIDNAGNESATSSTVSKNTPSCDSTAPSVPTGLVAAALSANRIDLSWNASTDTGGSGLAGYRVYRSGALVGTTAATSYSDTGLTEETQYCYRVAAYDSAGNSSTQSSQACGTTQATANNGEEWSWSGGDIGDDRAHAVAVDEAGNVVVAGHFYGIVDFGGGPLTSEHLPWLDPTDASDIFLAKYSVSGEHLWSRRIGGDADDQALGVTVDDSGDVIVTGICQNRVDFGDGTRISGGPEFDIFVAKYSGVNGEYMWAKRFEDLENGYGYSVAVDSGGEVLVTGQFTGSVDFSAGVDEPLISAGGADIFVAKLSGIDGSHQWSRSFGSTGAEYGYAIAVDGYGDVLVVGRFNSILNLGGATFSSAGSDDSFVAKLSGIDGSHQWSRSFGSAGYDYATAVAVDGNNNAIVTGYYEGSVNFGGGNLASAGAADIFLAKYSATGTHLWSKRFGATGRDNAHGIAVDSDDCIVMTGSFWNTVDFSGGNDEPLTSVHYSDIFVAKYSATGTHLWSERFGGNVSQAGKAVALNGTSNVAVAGFFEYKFDFLGESLISSGGYDAFLLSLEP